MTNLVKTLMGKAKNVLAVRGTPPKLSGPEARLQQAFQNNPALTNNDALADLAEAISGFRPRTTAGLIDVGDVVWIGSTMNRPALVVFRNYPGDNKMFCCTGVTEQKWVLDQHCRLASQEEANRFLNEQVQFWTDAAFVKWAAEQVGANNLPAMFSQINAGQGGIDKV